MPNADVNEIALLIIYADDARLRSLEVPPVVRYEFVVKAAIRSGDMPTELFQALKDHRKMGPSRAGSRAGAFPTIVEWCRRR
jgi:hypothetical protein